MTATSSVPPMKVSSEKTYGRILKATAMLGGASVINIGLGIFRTKILAVELGPELFGVMGLYTTLILMIQNIASLGLGQSAVRDIAAASGSGDAIRIARTIRAFRRVVIVTGIAGIVLTVAASSPASALTFSNYEHVWAISMLSLVVLFGEIQAGQNALLSGLRRIEDLSALNVLGALWSTLLAIPILLYYRERGIVPFLIAVSLGQLAASWWYARRVQVAPVQLSLRDTWKLSRSMLHLGVSFIVAGLLTSISAYVIRIAINRHCGEAAVGLYQSAFTISNIYVGFVLATMGADYFPRLAESGSDTARRNQLVNEQTQVATLLAVPGLLAALTFSDHVIWAMYSSRFEGASQILRWLVLGLLGRVISWPLGYILLARNDGRGFVLSELAATSAHLLLMWLGLEWFGIEGAGIAFAAQYLCYVPIVFWIAQIRHDYANSVATRNILLMAALVTAASFAATFIPSPPWRLSVGLLLIVTCSIFCLHHLLSLAPSRIPARWQRAFRLRPIEVQTP